MYTQCPDCATVFRVTAEALRTAQGNVRCGVCSTSFDALENLSEEPFRAAQANDESPPPEDTITVEEMPGNEDIELSTVAEADPAPAEEPSFEFDGSMEDLDRLFVELPVTELQHMAATARTGETKRPPLVDPAAVAASLTLVRGDQERTDEYPILVLDESDEVMANEVIELSTPELREPEPSPFETPRFVIPDAMRKGLEEEAAAVAFDVTDFGDSNSEGGPRRWPWTVGAAVLALALMAQVVHAERDQLIQKPTIGPLLARTYSLLGLQLLAPTDLSSYELRQWGAASDATQAGRLLLRASIVNRANYAQPYPLLRLALQDRFGTTVGMRDIEPADYLPGSGAPSLLDPGQRADAEIRIVDPGRDAVGFEMDVCLDTGAGVHCANEAPPPAT